MSASEFVSTFFNPTYLFIFLNLIIGTIYIISRLAKPHQPAPLGQAASLLINKVRAIDLPFFKFESHPEPDPVHYHYNPGMDSAVVNGPPLAPAPAPSLLDRFRSINFYQKKFEHPDPEPETLHPAEAVYNSAVSHEQPPLSRAPSILDKLKSTNFYHQKSYRQTDAEPVNTSNQASLALAPSFLECVKSIKLPSFYNPGEANLDTESDHEDVDGLAEDHVRGPVRRIRSESERMGQQGPKPRMRKTASEKSAAAAAAEAKDKVEAEEIGAKADDFIQRFRQQLRLQRLDSLIRYKDFLTGGGAGAAR